MDNNNANFELDSDTSDTAEPPLVCEYCGTEVESLRTVEDIDRSVGYYGTLDVCKACLESRRRP